MYEIIEQTVDQMRASAEALFVEHWDEIALNKTLMALKPDYSRYYAMEQQDALIILGAFQDGELVGYSVNFVINHLHYADLRIASNDLLFVHPAHRKGRLGLHLIKRTEEAAQRRGAQMMLWHAKPNTALNEIMPRLGYGVQDVIYSRGL